MGEDGAAERFWLELQTLYQAAGKPTLKQMVRVGRKQNPEIVIGQSTINGWLNSKAVPVGRKNERYLTALIIFLQARVGSDARYERLPQGEWGRLLRAAQAQRAAGKRNGRPRRPDVSPREVDTFDGASGRCQLARTRRLFWRFRLARWSAVTGNWRCWPAW